MHPTIFENGKSLFNKSNKQIRFIQEELKGKSWVQVHVSFFAKYNVAFPFAGARKEVTIVELEHFCLSINVTVSLTFSIVDEHPLILPRAALLS